MKFNRQLFKEAFKQGYKRAKQTLKEGKETKSDDPAPFFKNVYDQFKRLGRQIDLRAEMRVPDGKHAVKYLEWYPSSPYDIVFESPTSEDRMVICPDDVKTITSVEYKEWERKVDYYLLELKDGRELVMYLLDR